MAATPTLDHTQLSSLHRIEEHSQSQSMTLTLTAQSVSLVVQECCRVTQSQRESGMPPSSLSPQSLSLYSLLVLVFYIILYCLYNTLQCLLVVSSISSSRLLFTSHGRLLHWFRVFSIIHPKKNPAFCYYFVCLSCVYLISILVSFFY